MANPERNRDLSDNGGKVGRPAPQRSGTASNVVPGFQPGHFGEIRSQGVALGWYIAAPSALRKYDAPYSVTPAKAGGQSAFRRAFRKTSGFLLAQE